ncbi:MAG TPA: hypothetical protein VG388_03420 [Solirubrobacteraceae bacterium]|nr:hypothetical protein [Solirubrobacteraceae bacterium]
MSDTSLQNVEGITVTLLVVGYLLWYVIRKLQRSQPDLRIGTPVMVGIGLRLAAIAGISATGLSATLRGGDELSFLGLARVLAAQPLGHGDFPHGLYQLQTVLFTLEFKLGFLDQGAMRIIQVGIASLGVVLILAAVHDLANARAARLAAWLLALEPASLFFNSALHKEPLMELASGLVVYGGTRIWLRLDVRGILLCALGGLIAVETRSYAGWFLIAAAVLVLFHAALRGLDRPMKAMPLIYGVLIIAFIATPVILQASSRKSLQQLQVSQNANTSAAGTGTGGPNGNNLALEQVNFSTRGAILANLPKRIRDLILKPYPWQLGDTSQRFGAIGALFAYAILLLLLRYAWLARGRILAHIAPVLYPLLFLLIAYSLSAGNAGTGFRYRTHLVTLAVAAMAIVREQARLARVSGEPRLAEIREPAPVPTVGPVPSPV